MLPRRRNRLLKDSDRIDHEIAEIESLLNKLRNWFNTPPKYSTFNHAKLKVEIGLRLSELMRPGVSLSDAQARQGMA
jgi:uncharacterized membrane-anchored protein